MAIRAYNELYLPYAQDNLGHAADFAIMTLEIEPDLFGSAFAVSDCSKQFAEGNPAYLTGMNGCELARKVLQETHVAFNDRDDAMYLDKSPEYWAGWALAYYQWYKGCSFMRILQAVPFSGIIQMYTVFHEMDITHFAQKMDERMKKAYPRSALWERRTTCGLSQAELAAEAGISIRQIQLFEQGQRDINKAAAHTIYKLSKALHCRMEELME